MNHCGAEEQAIIEEELDSAARLVLRSVEIERNQLCRQKRLASPGCMQRFLGHGARRAPLNRWSRKFRGFFHLRWPPSLEARLQHSCSTVVAEQAYCAYRGPKTGLYVRRNLL